MMIYAPSAFSDGVEVCADEQRPALLLSNASLLCTQTCTDKQLTNGPNKQVQSNRL